MKALQISRSLPRFAAARLTGGKGPVSVLQQVDTDPLERPTEEWLTIRPLLSGICGSDLATLEGYASRWFEPIVTFPFVPGHEIVGLDPEGNRVTVEPVLSCRVRGIDPACPACTRGHDNHCHNLSGGHLRPGLQTGYCADVGGGWSDALVAHPTQLHPVPDDLSDEAAVLTEPVACAVHAALAGAGAVPGADFAVVIGAGMLGLGTVAALSQWHPELPVVAVAKHPLQRLLATQLGAQSVVEPEELFRAVRRRTGCTMRPDGGLGGGAPLVIDCVGSASSLAQALAVTAPGGYLQMVGMPGEVHVDLTPLWQREISLVGAYAYGPEPSQGGTHSFELATELIRVRDLQRLVTATYPLERHAQAVAHAAAAGSRGATKIAFDLRKANAGARKP